MTVSPAVLAVDVGNSKTDLALVGRRRDRPRRGARPERVAPGGRLRPGDRDPPRAWPPTAAAQAGLAADGVLAPIGAFCMAGLDTPRDERRLRRGLARAGLAERAHPAQRRPSRSSGPGPAAGWGVAVVAGAGTNGAGVGPTGRIARFGGLGDISGDYEGVGLARPARGGPGPRRARSADDRSSGSCPPTSACAGRPS